MPPPLIAQPSSTSSTVLAAWIEDLPELLGRHTLRNILGCLYSEDFFGQHAEISFLTPDEPAMHRDHVWREYHLSKGTIFFQNLQHFKKVRKALDEAANNMDGMKDVEENTATAPINKIQFPDSGKYDPSCRQQKLGDEEGAIVESLDDLFDAADEALSVLEEVLKRACADAGVDESRLHLAPLKGKSRAKEKAADDYGTRQPGPAEAWLYDIVRGKVIFQTGKEVISFLETLQKNAEILRMKNRCLNALFNGYRDLLINLRVTLPNGVKHICEVQLHLEPIVAVTKVIDSHLAYEYFRSYFKGNDAAVKNRLETLLSLPSGENDTVSSSSSDHLSYKSMEGVVGALIRDPNTDISMLVDTAQLMKDIGGVDTMPLRKKCLEARLELAKKSGNGPSMVMAMNDLATMLQDEGDIKGARSLMEYVLNVSEQMGGPMHPRTLTAMGNLGSFLFIQKFYDDAEPLMKECHKRYAKSIGPDHPRTLAALNNIAMLQKANDDLPAAIETFSRCLEGFMSKFGPNHPAVAQVRNNIGELLMSQNDLEGASKHFNEGVAVFERTLGPSHPETAVARKNQSMILAREGKWDEAVTKMHSVVKTLSLGLGNEHPVTIRAKEIREAYQAHKLET